MTGCAVRISRAAWMRRRIALRACALALLSGTTIAPVAASFASAPPTLANWDAQQQREVTSAGLMSDVGGSFEGASALSAAQANASMAALAARLQSAAPEALPVVRTAQNPVSVVTFDRLVIEQLGLRDVAVHVQSVAQAAGLDPPYYFGSEVVARFLELRYDHPAGTDRLELFPTDPITRAEAAWSLSRVMGFGSWNVPYAQEALTAFQLPSMSAAQRQALQIAISRIGYPYVWGGTTDNTADGLEHGGLLGVRLARVQALGASVGRRDTRPHCSRTGW